MYNFRGGDLHNKEVRRGVLKHRDVSFLDDAAAGLLVARQTRQTFIPIET